MSAASPHAITILGQNEALASLAAAGGVGSPFQSAGWLACWLEAMKNLNDFRLVDIKTGGGSILLPVHISNRAGMRLACKVGGGHASFFTPVRVGNPESLSPDVLKAATRALGADAMILTDCPAIWAGTASFTACYPRAPDLARGVTLRPDAAPAGGEAAKKLRAKVRKLSTLGARTQALAPEDSGHALATLLGWKAAQFAERGIADAFADADIRHFMQAGLARGVLRLFALRHEGRIIAALLLTQAGEHASAMTIAYDPTPDIARLSPGDVLVSQTLDILKSEGVTGFDLGVGEARYKRLHCPDAIALVDVHAAATLKGAAFCTLHALARRAKGILKRNHAAFAALSALRAGFRRSPAT